MTTVMMSPMHRMELLKRIADNPSIPSPPPMVMRVLEKASKPDTTVAELSQLIQVDAGLSGKVLRIVNSALFGLSRPASSVQRALAVVGVNSTRLLLLATCLPEMWDPKKMAPQLRQRYWRASVAGAIVAHALSQRMRYRDAEDDMAAALLRDLGELILSKLHAREMDEVFREPAEALVESQCDLEQRRCGMDHASVSAFILDRWRLPKEMTEAIRHHHRAAGGSYTTDISERRAWLLEFASRAAYLLLYPEQTSILQALQKLALERFRMNDETLHQFLVSLSRKMAEFASLLQVDLGNFVDFESILARASEELVRLSVAASSEGQKAIELTRRAESEAQRWRQEAVFDPLTKIFNRRFLELKLNELCGRTEPHLGPWGLMFIDLDGFKPLNDRFGHPFGDLVLCEVANSLNRVVRNGDIVVRYGGDEFCVLSESIDEDGLYALSKRVWQAINELRVIQGNSEGRVGASIGAVCQRPGNKCGSPQQLLAAADRAMYAAKATGKNRIVFLDSPDLIASPPPAPIEPQEVRR